MIKSTIDGRVKGRAIVYYGKDVTGDQFTPYTILDDGARPFIGMPVYYDHALNGVKSSIGMVTSWEPTDEGIDVEIELNRRHKYYKQIMELIQRGALGLSTGAVPHLVEREGGVLKRWPVAELSVTPTPAEPRTYAAVKMATTVNAAPGAEPVVYTHYVTGVEPVSNEFKFTDEASFTARVEDLVDARINSMVGEPVKGGGVVAGKAPAVKKLTTLGNSNDDTQAFWHWLKTGDNIAAKAAMNEGTGANGGYIAPAQPYDQIIGRRDELSILSVLPITRFTTSYQRVDVPTQSQKSDFAFTAEAGAVNFDEPTFAQAAIQVYTATLAMKISNQLLRDEKANLDQFLTEEIARAAARNINEYIIKGTGSSQPYGLVTRVTQSATFTSASAIDFDDVFNVQGAVPSPYWEEGANGWALRGSTLSALRGLTGNYTQAGNLAVTRNSIDEMPAHRTDFVDATGTTKKSLWFGNWRYYMFVENAQMEISRNPWLYQANGQTGIFVTMRWGGDVTQAEAFAYGVHP